ncbi:MAG TPA: TIGR04255 family protein [Gemmataceae bacterium]|nr:TIGR04255 family protein [Gemmataceae bacterium]
MGKPPIIQAWIEFRFDHATDRPEWGWPLASAFFDQFQNDYPEREVMVHHQFQIAKVESKQKPRVVDERVDLAGMRAFQADRGRYLQLSQDSLVCNFVRTDAKGYEGFDALKREALSKLRAYVNFFRPTRLLQLAMQYVDLVRIPFQQSRIELKDYFTLGYDLPEEVFGPTLNFLVQYATRPPGSRDILEVRLWNEQLDPEGPTGQFRMDWRLVAFEELSFAQDVLGPRLDQAHERLLDCFKKSFTPQAWAMFEPVS